MEDIRNGYDYYGAMTIMGITRQVWNHDHEVVAGI